MSGEILLTGGTGLMGARIAHTCSDAGQSVDVLTRRERPAHDRTRYQLWDGRTLPERALAGRQAVIHLAGEPIFGGVPSQARRRRMFESRILSTRNLVASLGLLSSAHRPRTLLCASAVGYYGDRDDHELTESASPGEGFLAELCVQWEREALEAQQFGVRVVSLRYGVVLAPDGGALPPLRRLFGLGLGGRLGHGRQFFSWIHVDDAVALTLRALRDEAIEGPINVVAPKPVRNADFTRSLARAVRRPAVFAVPGFVLERALGDLASELLGSRRVVPAKAQALHFDFRHSDIDSALASALARDQTERRS